MTPPSPDPNVSHPSPEEAGRYLETYKAYEQKPADLLMEKLEQDFVSRVRPPHLPAWASPQLLLGGLSCSSDLESYLSLPDPTLSFQSLLLPRQQLEGSS